MNNRQLTKKEKYFLKKEQKERERFRRARQNKIKKVVFISLPIFLIVGGIVFIFLTFSPSSEEIDKPKITVFYDPTCSCCVQYISYLKRNGFEVFEEKEMAKRMDILEEYQIPQNMTACHTNIIGDYFVEGLMPAEIIKKLLEEKPEIDGIALPGMPQGAPGMPDFKTGKWTIYAFSNGQPSEFLSW